MAAPARTKAERERDLVLLADLICQSVPQAKIAEQLHVSQPVVSRDVQTLYGRWREQANLPVDELAQRELARIDHLEGVAWQAWEHSLATAEKSVTAKTDHDGIVTTSARVEKVDTTGDPRFLQIVERCIKARRELLGLDRPVKVEHSGPDGGAIPIREIVAVLPGEDS